MKKFFTIIFLTICFVFCLGSLSAVALQLPSHQRFMRSRCATAKKDVNGRITETIPAGSHREFVDKFRVGTTWYLRTAWSRRINKLEGIPEPTLESSVVLIPSHQRFMRSRCATAKKDVNGRITETIPAGSHREFVDKFRVGTTLYLRTAWSRRINKLEGIPEPTLESSIVPIPSLSVPKIMRVQRTVRRVDPTGRLMDFVAVNTVRPFLARFQWSGKWYYITEWSYKRGSNEGILKSDLVDVVSAPKPVNQQLIAKPSAARPVPTKSSITRPSVTRPAPTKSSIAKSLVAKLVPIKSSVTKPLAFSATKRSIANTSVFQYKPSSTKLSITNTSIFQPKPLSTRLSITDTSVFQPKPLSTKLSVTNTSVFQPSTTLPLVRIERLSVPKTMRFKQTVCSPDSTGKIVAGTERKFVARFEWEGQWYYITDWSMKRRKDGILADYLVEVQPSAEDERFERERAGIFDFGVMIYAAQKQVNKIMSEQPQNITKITAAQAYLDFLKIKQQQTVQELAVEWSQKAVDTIDEQFRRDLLNLKFYKRKLAIESAPELNYDLLNQIISQNIRLHPEKKDTFAKYLAFINGKWKVSEAEKWLHGGGDCIAFNLYMEVIQLFDQANQPNEKTKALTSIQSIAEQAMKKGITYFNYGDYQVAWGTYRKTNYFYEKLKQLGDNEAEAKRLAAAVGMNKSLDAAKRNRKDDLDQWWKKVNSQSETKWQNDLGFMIVNDELSLRSLNANYNCFIPSKSWTSKEVRVHKYNVSNILLDSFRIPIKQDSALRQKISQNLGIDSGQLNEKEFVITIQNPVNFKGMVNFDTNFLLRPQWVFERYYGEGDDNLALSVSVDTKVKVFSSNSSASSAFSITGNPSWYSLAREQEIYRNEEGVEITRFPRLSMSGNIHSLGFNNIDTSSKIVLSNTRFLDGPVQGEIKTALNILFSKAAYNRFKDCCKTQRTVGDIFKTLHSEGHVQKDIMELLEIPVN